MKWSLIESADQLDDVLNMPQGQRVLIYKHSYRCGICSGVKHQLEEAWREDLGIIPFFVDVVKNRGLSQEIARRLNVGHESPQAILVEGGRAVYHASHFDIALKDFPGVN